MSSQKSENMRLGLFLSNNYPNKITESGIITNEVLRVWKEWNILQEDKLTQEDSSDEPY